MVNHNGQNGNGNAEYIKYLLTPSGKKSGDRRSWSISIENTWVPFFTATNVKGDGVTPIPDDVLGMPLRLAKQKDGSIRFSDSGRPVMRVAPELNAQIAIVRQKFEASLHAYTGSVQAELPDAYKAQVMAAQLAAKPILETSEKEVVEAVALLRAMEAAKNSHVQATPPETTAAPTESSANGNGSETPSAPPAEAPAKGRKREPVAA